MTRQGGSGRNGGVSRRHFVAAGSAAVAGATIGAPAEPAAASRRAGRPNILLVYLDDLGYGDLGCYGSQVVRTPNLDRLAAEGTRFTQGYSGAPVCSPSRAALLTGRVPPRTGVTDVLDASESRGLPPTERTIAEYLRGAGYYTACIGKWHVGRPSEHNPLQHGFTSFFGLNAVYTANTYPIDLWRDEQVVGSVTDDADLATLTRRFTDEAIAAIDRAGDRPFFVYLAEVMPHLPLAVEPQFADRSRAGTYGDVIEATDHHLGRLFDTLRARGLDRDTLVVVASDNGPWFQGSVGGLRGRKYDVFEGGTRVPFIARRPGTVPARTVSSDIVSVLDLLPTFCSLAGVRPDPSITLDGTDLGPALRGARHKPRPPIYYYLGDQLAAVREGKWKLHVRRRGSDQRYLPELYDLHHDPRESYDLAGRNPGTVERLQRLIAEFEASVRDEPPLPGVVLDAGPLFAGREGAVKVTLTGAARPDGSPAAQVTAAVEAPQGWATRPVTQTVDLSSNPSFEVPVTPPAGTTPSPGKLATFVLTAKATIDGVPFSDTARAVAYVVPHGDDVALALDAGTPEGPLLPSYRRLVPGSVWDSAVGYGWVGAAPQARDRNAPDALRRDMVTSQAPAVLRLRIPAGRRTVSILRGDHGFATTGIQVETAGEVVVPTGADIAAGEYWWEQFTLDGGADGRTVDLRLSNTENVYWKVLALLVR
ncbi:Arylsulfatase A [Thermomonospora echinospora]|uniref:Arylsulfatase A n=1 Tax=Thermomonospora echinospora TaxID=1992 RepID=A0A1H6E3N3_9ACTN|nr:sulfatase [Thermomonospora echinospora]SEG91674.1 Arylsulfatase A [Thermomonospora echinospora]